MNYGYLLVKFAHLLGAAGFFAAYASEWVGVEGLRRASDAEQARRAISVCNRVQWVGLPSLLLLLGAGIYLTTTAWSWEAGWIGLSIGALVLMAVLGGAINGRKIAALQRALPASGPLDASWRARVGDPLLSLSLRLRIALTVGILFLMTMKLVEHWKGLVVIAVALVAGALASLPAWRRL
jgi:hypothetical protein